MSTDTCAIYTCKLNRSKCTTSRPSSNNCGIIAFSLCVCERVIFLSFCFVWGILLLLRCWLRFSLISEAVCVFFFVYSLSLCTLSRCHFSMSCVCFKCLRNFCAISFWVINIFELDSDFFLAKESKGKVKRNKIRSVKHFLFHLFLHSSCLSSSPKFSVFVFVSFYCAWRKNSRCRQ